MNRYRVDYVYGTYSGTDTVFAEDGDHAVALFWSRARRRGLLTLPMAAQSAKATRQPDPEGSP